MTKEDKENGFLGGYGKHGIYKGKPDQFFIRDKKTMILLDEKPTFDEACIVARKMDHDDYLKQNSTPEILRRRRDDSECDDDLKMEYQEPRIRSSSQKHFERD